MTDPHSSSAASDLRATWGRPRCGYHANAAMLWIGQRFLHLGYLFIYFAAAYFFIGNKRARRASRSYLDRIYPQRSLIRRHFDTYRHMVEYGRLLLDRAIMLAGPRHGFTIRCDDAPNLAAAVDQGNGVVLFTAHLGSTEASVPYLRSVYSHGPVNIVMYQQTEEETERFHTRHRARLADVRIISSTDPLAAGVKIMQALRRKEMVAMRADRTLSGKTLPITLLGAPLTLPAGPFVAAALSGSPVVHVYAVRTGCRKYICTMSAPRTYGDNTPGTREERIGRAAADFAEHLESIMRERPFQWANFYDLWNPNADISQNA